MQCEEIDEDNGRLDATEGTDSVMKMYARHVHERLRAELSSNGSATDNWLVQKLKDNGWWLRAADARDVMLRLSANSNPVDWATPFYIRDIFVWLPDVRWGETPICPNCKTSRDVHVHDYKVDRPTRRYGSGE